MSTLGGSSIYYSRSADLKSVVGVFKRFDDFARSLAFAATGVALTGVAAE